jgi:hypothetical protein
MRWLSLLRERYVGVPDVKSSRRILHDALQGGLDASPPECPHHHHVWRDSLLHFVRPLYSRLTPSFTASEFLAEVDRLTPSLHNPNAAMSAVVIKNGSVFVARSAALNRIHVWQYYMLLALCEASKITTLPDSFFFVTASDWPLHPRSTDPKTLLFSVNSGDGHWDIPVPGGQFTSNYDAAMHENAGVLESLPWARRSPSAVWRGSLMCEDVLRCESRCIRLRVRQVAARHPDLLDVHFSDLFPEPNTNYSCVRSLDFGNFDAKEETGGAFDLPLPNQLRHRFLLATDGHSYASGYKHFLLTGSTVLRQRSNFLEFFDPALQPWVHYVPFDCRSVEDCDLVPFLEQHVRDTAEAATSPEAADRIESLRRIGEASRDFAQTHLGKMGRSCYWHLALHTVSPLIDPRDSGIPDEWLASNAVCVSCAADLGSVGAWDPR